MIWVAFVLAQEPSPTDVDDDVEVIDIYQEARVEAARRKVEANLRNLGYGRRIEKDGAVVMRHDSAWKGDVWLHDDGWMEVKRQPVRFEAPKKGGWPSCVLLPFRCIRSGGQTVSKRKFRAVETRTVGSVAPGVSQWGDRVADLRVDQKLQDLPTQMEALWEDGVPLEGPPSLIETDRRKDALLRFWETRTENPWGEKVRESVEGFLNGVVQSSDTPITAEELVRFNRQSRAGRPLVLRGI